MTNDQIALAQARADHARERLAEALTALKQRLLPSTIAHNLVQGAKDKGADAAQAGVAAVKASPGIAVGLAALAGLFLARKPIARAISGNDEETQPASARSAHDPRKVDR